MIISTLLLMQLMVKAALWDEEDEDSSKKRKYHNFLINTLSQYISQATFLNSPEGIEQSLTSFPVLDYLINFGKLLDKSNKKRKVSGYVAAFSFAEGEVMEKFVLPSLARNEFGFEPSMKKQYSPTMFDDMFTSEEILSQKSASAIRKLYRSDIKEKKNLTDKEALRETNLKFPAKEKGKEHTYTDLLKSYREIQEK